MRESRLYEVNKESRNKNIYFNVFNKDGKIIGEIKMKYAGVDDETGQKYYSLKTINSFDKEKGVKSAMLDEVEKFAREQNAVIGTILWKLELETTFKKRGWKKLTRTDSKIWLRYIPNTVSEEINEKNDQ